MSSTPSILSSIMYTLAFVLLLLYFCWENGPHHRSHRIEVSYFICVLCLLILATAVLETDPSIQSHRDALYCTSGNYHLKVGAFLIDYASMLYLSLHLFISLIPMSSEQLEGVPLTPNITVSHSVLRKVRDIENLVYDVHESGPAGE